MDRNDSKPAVLIYEGRLLQLHLSMQKRDPIRFLICALLLTLVILFEYGESFRFYFFGDDFTYIEFVLQEKAGILWKSPSLMALLSAWCSAERLAGVFRHS